MNSLSQCQFLVFFTFFTLVVNTSTKEHSSHENHESVKFFCTNISLHGQELLNLRGVCTFCIFGATRLAGKFDLVVTP